MSDSIVSLSETALGRPSWRQRGARALLFRVLEGIRGAELRVTDATGTRIFGSRDADLRATIVVHDASVYEKLLVGGSVAAGGAYASGLWDADDLTGLIRILARNREVLGRWRRGPGWAMRVPGFLHHLRRKNSRRGSRDNILAHYDLGNDFFAQFLDSAMMYSSAYYEDPAMDLEAASRAKMDLICRKLELGPDDHLLEIGTGWGGLAVHAARTTGCRVTTTTISPSQFAMATERVRGAGLEDRVTVLDRDYQDLEGRFSRIVSVEMIEAVGRRYLDTFFATCSRLLETDGVMLLQAITIDDEDFERAARSVDFIQHYIFPGSCIPSMGRMGRAVREHTDLRSDHLQDLTPHYARTLADWKGRFQARRETLETMGFDRFFRRLWEFYFSYCEGGFREDKIGVVQWRLTGPGRVTA